MAIGEGTTYHSGCSCDQLFGVMDEQNQARLASVAGYLNTILELYSMLSSYLSLTITIPRKRKDGTYVVTTAHCNQGRLRFVANSSRVFALRLVVSIQATRYYIYKATLSCLQLRRRCFTEHPICTNWKSKDCPQEKIWLCESACGSAQQHAL
jgi:hypothetical protein